jgi:putative ABC transport system substrate-binding protein
VFTTVADPIGAGYVDSLAQPGGNATGFLVWEYSIAAKWLELLKEIAPHVTRAMVFRQSAVAAGPGQFGVIQAAAPSLGVDLRVADVRDAGEIERAVTTFAQGSNGGLIVTGSPGAISHRTLIVALAARHRLPAVYPGRYFAVLRRSHPQRREARRPAGAGANQVRAGDQPQNREGARPHRPAGRVQQTRGRSSVRCWILAVGDPLPSLAGTHCAATIAPCARSSDSLFPSS